MSSGPLKTSTSAGRGFPATVPVLKTPKPDGQFRDEIVVEILSMDDRDFTGTITPTEARINIFEDILGYPQSDLASVIIGYNRGSTVTY